MQFRQIFKLQRLIEPDMPALKETSLFRSIIDFFGGKREALQKNDKIYCGYFL
jgi:hypothetical protein